MQKLECENVAWWCLILSGSWFSSFRDVEEVLAADILKCSFLTCNLSRTSSYPDAAIPWHNRHLQCVTTSEILQGYSWTRCSVRSLSKEWSLALSASCWWLRVNGPKQNTLPSVLAAATCMLLLWRMCIGKGEVGRGALKSASVNQPKDFRTDSTEEIQI